MHFFFFIILFKCIWKADICLHVPNPVRCFRMYRRCLCVRSHVCIRDFPCRLSNMCCHWETHWEDLLNLALTPETPTHTVLSPALCRTPLKPRRLNSEEPTGLPLQTARLNWEENQNQFLSVVRRNWEKINQTVLSNRQYFFLFYLFIFGKILKSETHAKLCSTLSTKTRAKTFFMFRVYGIFVASGFALAVVCYRVMSCC